MATIVLRKAADEITV